ncbi:MAG: hypothetical protein HKM89_09705 [Gemmatimonadales bacterium]|nr:hypothetical protein [Gemmatimonadales bacterium]
MERSQRKDLQFGSARAWDNRSDRLNPRDVSLLPDRQGLVVSVEESVSDAWLIENFDPEIPPAAE